MTFDDWKRCLEHDLDRGHLSCDQEYYFKQKAMWLCARRQDVEMRNAMKLMQLAQSEEQIVHQIYAQQVRINEGEALPKYNITVTGGFRRLRRVLQLVRGCKIMLSCDVKRDWGMTQFARGSLIGIVYGKDGIGNFPEAIVVDLPDYVGPFVFYPGHPTWVPIRPMMESVSGKHTWRVQFPIVAGYAQLMIRAQGRTFPEGVVIHMSQKMMDFTYGLFYMTCMRSNSFAMIAFKHLPSYASFRKGQSVKMMVMRKEFEQKLQQRHRGTMARYSGMVSSEAEDQEYERWCDDEAMPRSLKRPRIGSTGPREDHTLVRQAVRAEADSFP